LNFRRLIKNLGKSMKKLANVWYAKATSQEKTKDNTPKKE
jgi:hypothetical protein